MRLWLVTLAVVAAEGSDALGRLGITATAPTPALGALRTSLDAWGVPALLEALAARAATRGSGSGAFARRRRAHAALRGLTSCLVRDANASDCVTLALPCARIFNEMVHYGRGGCAPILGPSLAPPQAAAFVEKALGAEAIYVWGGGGALEAFGPLAAVARGAEHAKDWCACLGARPLLRCLGAASVDVACTRHDLRLKPFGRLAGGAGKGGDGIKPADLVAAHRRYVDAIAEAGVATYDAILVDGRAHASCALRALGFARSDTAVFVNGWPRKFGFTVRRYYDVVRTLDAAGGECADGEPRCMAVLAPKKEFAGDNGTHARHIARFKLFLRSPTNF